MSYKVDDPSADAADNVLDECELVRHAQAGDHLAFEKLYERYNDRISRFFIRMVSDYGVGC